MCGSLTTATAASVINLHFPPLISTLFLIHTQTHSALGGVLWTNTSLLNTLLNKSLMKSFINSALPASFILSVMNNRQIEVNKA